MLALDVSFFREESSLVRIGDHVVDFVPKHSDVISNDRPRVMIATLATSNKRKMSRHIIESRASRKNLLNSCLCLWTTWLLHSFDPITCSAEASMKDLVRKRIYVKARKSVS